MSRSTRCTPRWPSCPRPTTGALLSAAKRIPLQLNRHAVLFVPHALCARAGARRSGGSMLTRDSVTVMPQSPAAAWPVNASSRAQQQRQRTDSPSEVQAKFGCFYRSFSP